MANDKERVEYSFTGDTSSLRAAVNAAIDMLAKYADSMKASFDKVNNTTKPAIQSMISKVQAFNKVLGTLAAKMTRIKTIAQLAFGSMSMKASTVAAAFRRVVPGADNIAKALKIVASASKKASSGVTTFSTGLVKLYTSFNKVIPKMHLFSSNAKLITDSVNLLRSSMAALTSITLADWFEKSTKTSIDYIETLNLFNVAMGSSIDMANEYISKMAEIYGMDPKSLMDTAGTFYLLEDAIAMPSKSAAKLSLSLTKAANDVASLYNMPIEKVSQDFQSGMQGMTRAVRKYGFDVRITTLQQKAMELGIAGNANTMSEANRQALRFIVMMEQMHKSTRQMGIDATGAAASMGDFANTIESPANQLRIFKEQITQLGRSIGNYLLVPLTKVIAYINGFIMALRTAINYVAQLLGIMNMLTGFGTSKAADAAESMTSGLNSISDAAGGAAKKIKDLIAPFDELNVLSQDTGGGGGIEGLAADEIVDPKLLEAIDNMSLQLENIEMKANRVRDSLLKAFGFELKPEGDIVWSKDLFKDSLEQMFPQWTDTIEEAFANWNLESIGQIIGVIVSGSMTKFADYISWDNIGAKVQEVITTMTTVLNAAVTTMDGSEIGRAFGETVNTASQALYTAWSTVNWKELGKKISDSISGLFSSIDWEVLGANIVRTPTIILEMLGGAFANMDWTLVSQSLVTGFMSALNTLAEAVITNAPIIIQSMVTGVTTLLVQALQALPEIVNVALQIVQALATGIINALPVLTESIPELTASITRTLVEAIPMIAETGIAIFTALIQELPTIILNLVDAAGQMIGQVLSAIAAAIPQLIIAGIDLFIALIGALPEIIATLVAAIPQIVVALVNGFTDNIDLIIAAGIELLVSLIAALPRIIVEIVKAVPQIIASLVQAFMDLLPEIIETGKQLISGIWQGILDAKEWLKEKVHGWVDGLISDVKDWFGIASPSKVFAEIGGYTVEGFAKGMNESSDATQASEAMFNNVMDTTKGFTGQITVLLRTTFEALTTNLMNFTTTYLKLTQQFGTQVLNAFQSLWSAVMETTVSAQSSLQDRLNQMVRSAQQAARDIAKAVKDASSAAASMSSISTSVTTTIASSKVPKMATGGVVTSPTLALVGEAGYSEAVIPLGDSPQMAELINKIAEATAGRDTSSSTPVEVKVYIGQDEFDAYTYKAAQKGQRIVGRQPITIGG